MRFGRWIIVVLVAAIAAGTVYWVVSKPASAGYSTISPAELSAKLDAGEKLVIVDLREPELFSAGHIPGARNIPFEQFNDRVGELNPADQIVLVCHMGQMGDVSGSILAERGYTKVSNLAGGMARWSGKLAK